jgi:hypothetical protein
MRNAIRISTFALTLVAVAALAIPLSNATCTNSVPIIGQPGETMIVFGPAGADAVSQDGVSPVQAAYWRFNAGNPVPAVGADNGIWGNDAANGGPWFFDAASDGTYITAGLTDGDGTSDGCINGANDSGGDADDDAILAGCGPDGKFFVVAGSNQVNGSVMEFGAGPYTAINTPQIVITGSTRQLPTGVQITFSTPTLDELDNGYFDFNAGIPSSAVFSGLNVYRACVARGSGAPTNRLTAGNINWILVGTYPLGAVGQTASSDCGPGSFDTFLGVEPKFEGATPFTSGCITSLTRPVQAGTTIVNPSDPAPRTIKKPRGIRGDNQ